MDALSLTKATVNALDFEDFVTVVVPFWGAYVKQCLRQRVLTVAAGGVCVTAMSKIQTVCNAI